VSLRFYAASGGCCGWPGPVHRRPAALLLLLLLLPPPLLLPLQVPVCQGARRERV